VDLSQDEIFAEMDGLKWLPYVGENYFKNETRIFIIGESHYQEENETSIRQAKNVRLTRKMLTDFGIRKKYWKTKIFQNFYKALFRTDKINSVEFWKNLVFYNFVQRPMTNNKERPNKSDFKNSWTTTFKLIEILKPNVCIFIGVESANYFYNVIGKSNFEKKSFKEDSKISNTRPRKVIIVDKLGNEIKLIFIQHTSSRFSWDKWNKYLRIEMESEIKYLKRIITSE
jgi:uracil-DNA glycosylase